MRFDTKTHTHYCGIDLHAKTVYWCILDRDGQILLHKNIKSRPEPFLAAVGVSSDEITPAACEQPCAATWTRRFSSIAASASWPGVPGLR